MHFSCATVRRNSARRLSVNMSGCRAENSSDVVVFASISLDIIDNKNHIINKDSDGYCLIAISDGIKLGPKEPERHLKKTLFVPWFSYSVPGFIIYLQYNQYLAGYRDSNPSCCVCSRVLPMTELHTSLRTEIKILI